MTDEQTACTVSELGPIDYPGSGGSRFRLFYREILPGGGYSFNDWIAGAGDITEALAANPDLRLRVLEALSLGSRETGRLVEAEAELTELREKLVGARDVVYGLAHKLESPDLWVVWHSLNEVQCGAVDRLTGWRCCLRGKHERHLFNRGAAAEMAKDSASSDGSTREDEPANAYSEAREISLLNQALGKAQGEAEGRLAEIRQLYAAFEGSGHSPKNPREVEQAIRQMAQPPCPACLADPKKFTTSTPVGPPGYKTCPCGDCRIVREREAQQKPDTEKAWMVVEGEDGTRHLPMSRRDAENLLKFASPGSRLDPATSMPEVPSGMAEKAWVRCRQLALNHPERCILREGHDGAHLICGHPCPLLGDYCPECGVNGKDPPVEQPNPPPAPASAGKLGGPSESLRAELIEALRGVAEDMRGPDVQTGLLIRLADRLERGASKP